MKDIGYYNVLLKDFVTEPGEYIVYVGSSSRDIRLKESVTVNNSVPYTITNTGKTMMG